MKCGNIGHYLNMSMLKPFFERFSSNKLSPIKGILFSIYMNCISDHLIIYAFRVYCNDPVLSL